MTEDSGAFKTNPRDSVRSGHFVIAHVVIAHGPYGAAVWGMRFTL
jgi:hypothetical protein